MPAHTPAIRIVRILHQRISIHLENQASIDDDTNTGRAIRILTPLTQTQNCGKTAAFERRFIRVEIPNDGR